jgi:16S rRNA (cytosine967-C5)-methyltransferase
VSDLFPNKLAALQAEFERLGLPKPRAQPVDLSVGQGDLPAGFDRVLVDAPCTGTGTLRRRPEIARRLKPEDPGRLGELATEILRRASALAKAGGRVVFAVCSVLPEEAEAVVEAAADHLTPAPFDAVEIEPLIAPGATSFRLLPSRHGTDGYFVASFVRR